MTKRSRPQIDVVDGVRFAPLTVNLNRVTSKGRFNKKQNGEMSVFTEFLLLPDGKSKAPFFRASKTQHWVGKTTSGHASMGRGATCIKIIELIRKLVREQLAPTAEATDSADVDVIQPSSASSCIAAATSSNDSAPAATVTVDDTPNKFDELSSLGMLSAPAVVPDPFNKKKKKGRLQDGMHKENAHHTKETKPEGQQTSNSPSGQQLG